MKLSSVACTKRTNCYHHILSGNMRLMKLLRLIGIFFICSTILTAYLMTSYKSIDPQYIGQLSVAPNGTATILLWTSFYDQDDFYFGFGREAFVNRQCQVSDCALTNDRSQLLNAQAVVFHIFDMAHDDLPKQRLLSQRYVFYNFESPAYTFTDVRAYKNFFNWTVTYRTDSDVTEGITIVEKKSETTKNSTIPLAKRSKFAVWMVSHCWTYSHRESYIAQLKQFIPIDVVGDCGDVKIAECAKGSSYSQDDCWSYLEQNYKFYLSFENSLCKDYVTEKLFNPLNYRLLPVVFGGANYTKLTPPNSYINALDFQSPQLLANYLVKVASDDKLYDNYFQWKGKYKIGGSHQFCEMCRKLHDKTEPVKTYEDIDNWWTLGGNCLDPTQLTQTNRYTIAKYIDRIIDDISLFIRDSAINFYKKYL
ncbi:hypothetical protein CHUAL_008203 [Chamberlinius hualienensis]